MASSTPNIGLTLPVGTEKVSRQIVNQNMTKIDEKVGPVPNGQDLQSQVTSLSEQIGNLSFLVETVSASNNKDIDIGNNKKFIVIITGYSGALYFGRTTADGSMNLYKVNSNGDSNILVTSGTGKINVAWSGSGTLTVTIMYI